QKRVQLINQEVAAEVGAQLKIIAANPKNLKTRDAAMKAMQQSVTGGIGQLQNLQYQNPDNVVQNIQSQYQSVYGGLQGRLAIAQTGAAGMSVAGAPLSIQSQMQSAMEQHIKQLVDLLPQLKDYPDTWFKVYQNILQSTQQLMQFNEQFKQSQSIQPFVGQVFGTMSQQLQGLFGSHFARGLASAMSGVGQQLQAAPGIVTALRGGTAALDPKIQKEIQPVIDASSEIGKSLKDTSDVFTSGNALIKSSIVTLSDHLDNLSAKLGSVTGGSVMPFAGQTTSPLASFQRNVTAGGVTSP